MPRVEKYVRPLQPCADRVATPHRECVAIGIEQLTVECPEGIADADHESRKLARELMREDRWKLQIVKRRQRTFKIAGLTWIVEQSFAWLGGNRRFSKDYEYRVQTSEAMLDIAATRLMLNRLAPA